MKHLRVSWQRKQKSLLQLSGGEEADDAEWKPESRRKRSDFNHINASFLIFQLFIASVEFLLFWYIHGEVKKNLPRDCYILYFICQRYFPSPPIFPRGSRFSLPGVTFSHITILLSFLILVCCTVAPWTEKQREGRIFKQISAALERRSFKGEGSVRCATWTFLSVRGSLHVKPYREADKQKLNMTLWHGFTYVYARGRIILGCILKI